MALCTASKPLTSKTVFGVRISLSGDGSLVGFKAIRYLSNGAVKEERPFQRDEFIKMASGFWPSPYNPERRNYFEENEIFGGVFVDSTTNEKISYCPAIDSLWKLRFRETPFQGQAEAGWATGQYQPSPQQLKYLAVRYNIRQLDLQYIVDTNFWNLLHDVSDSTWIANYRLM